MFNKVAITNIDAYDAKTGKYLGKAKFKLTHEVESILLDMVNYNRAPSSIVLQDAELYQPSDGYVKPTPYQKYRRRVIASGLFTDSVSGEQIPIEVQFSYDALFRTQPYNNVYTSAEYNNIALEAVRYLNGR